MTRRYPSGIDFPSEGFVQTAIERYFHASGFEVVKTGDIDLSCKHPATGECWQIEAKGKTSSPGLDFQTCLGQLLVRMSTQEVRYAVAVPDLPAYRAQISKVQPWVAKSLDLSWLLVGEDQSVTIVCGHRS